MADSPHDRLSGDLAQQARIPGANRDTLIAYLRDRAGIARTEAEAIVGSVCAGLLGDRFPAIVNMELMLTEDCNQRCDYCFVEGKNDRRRMPLAIARQAVDFLIAHSRNETDLRILFFGGEPLLADAAIREIVAYANRNATAAGKRMLYSTTTNGTLLDETMCRELQRLKVAVLVSIDGDREDHDRHRRLLGGGSAYDRVAAGIAMLKRYQPWIGARMTVTPDAVPRLRQNVEHLAGLGVDQFLIGPVTGRPWPSEALDAYRRGMIDAIRDAAHAHRSGKPRRVSLLEADIASFDRRRHLWGCRAGRQSLTVATDGAIFPCSKMLGLNGLRGILPLGSLDDGLTEVYNRLTLCGRIPIARPRCDDCRLIDVCMGGCYATNAQATGSAFVPAEEDCRLHLAIVDVVNATRELLPLVMGATCAPCVSPAEPGAENRP